MILTACSSDKPQLPTTQIMNQYIQKFNQDLIAVGKPPINSSLIIVVYDESLTNYANVSPNLLNPTSHVTVKIGPSFLTVPPHTQLVITYHELGHGFYGSPAGHRGPVHRLMTSNDLKFEFSQAEIENDTSRQALVLDMVNNP